MVWIPPNCEPCVHGVGLERQGLNIRDILSLDRFGRPVVPGVLAEAIHPAWSGPYM
jgi:hypothetical protein